MILNSIIVGQLQANCYIVGDECTKEVIVIDPGAEDRKIFEIITEEGYKVKYILFTHGHADHISAGSYIKEKTDAKILIHKEDKDLLQNASRNLSFYIGENIEIKSDVTELYDGDVLKVGKYNFNIIHTPGHTLGGICVLVENILFSGDTLFHSSIGRTDLPGGNFNTLIKSIKEKLYVLNNNVEVYPGHGAKTSIGFEKENNAFIKG